jgi:uncharacterized protein YdhG (YjbR/CyaY superfamily)
MPVRTGVHGLARVQDPEAHLWDFVRMDPAASAGRPEDTMKTASVEAYLDRIPPDRRAAFDELRRTVRDAAPEADESIAYDMPSLRTSDGRYVVSYGAFKGHYSLFPANPTILATVGHEADAYVSGRGTFRFPAERPLPLALVTQIVRARVAQLAAGRGA